MINTTSRWNDIREVYTDGDFTLIAGQFSETGSKDDTEKALGAHWKKFPMIENILCPLVIPNSMRSAILNGLLAYAIKEDDEKNTKLLIKGLAFFTDDPREKLMLGGIFFMIS